MTDAEKDRIPREAPEQAGSMLGSTDEHFRVLLAALDLGWRVEEPVYIRPRWGESGNFVYHFILKKEDDLHPCLITVRHSPQIEHFVLQEGWKIDQQPPAISLFDFSLRAQFTNQVYL